MYESTPEASFEKCVARSYAFTFASIPISFSIPWMTAASCVENDSLVTASSKENFLPPFSRMPSLPAFHPAADMSDFDFSVSNLLNFSTSL